MKTEKIQREEDEMISKFQKYNEEVFQFKKNNNSTIQPIEESKPLIPTEKTSKLKNLNLIQKNYPSSNNIPTQIIEEKKEDVIENSLKGQSLINKPSIVENPMSSFQLGFNLFEVKNFDRKTFNTTETLAQSDNLIHKTSSQNDFLKNSLQMPSITKNQFYSEDSNRKKIHSHFRYFSKNN